MHTRPDCRVVGLTVIALGAAAVLHASAVPAGPLFDPHYTIPWWLLATVFAAGEILVIHLPSRRSAHTISLAEIPLVLGLAFVSPLGLIAGRLIGSAFALSLHRRQGLLKLAFNLSGFYLETVVALSVAGALSTGDFLAPSGWAATLSGVGGSSIIGALLVSIVISIHDPSRTVREVATQLYSGFVVSSGVGVIGLITAILLWVDVRSVVLVGIVGVLAHGAIRVFGRLYRRHSDLLSLHGFAAEIASDAASVDEAVALMLTLVEERLRVPGAVMVLDTGEGEPRLWAQLDGNHMAKQADPGELDRALTGISQCTHLDACECAALPGGGKTRGAAVAITEDARLAGVLFVMDRKGTADPIEGADRLLLRSMARHFSAVLSGLLANERLRAEVIEKERVIQSKDQLIASVSHEVRTPLTAVLGFSEILREGVDRLGPDELNDTAVAIATEATELSHIVEDLLTAARADLGRLEVYSVPTSVMPSIKRAVMHMLSPAGRSVSIEGSNVRAMADPARLRQIVRNLVANAHRYGGPNVVVRVEESERAVAIQVRDDGSGVPADASARIFEAYESAHPAGTQPSSVGLGLPISRDLARLMGGDLRYLREDGWTVFELVLEPTTSSPVVPIADRRTA